MYLLMIFMFFFFIGFVAMFFYVMRRQENIRHELSEDHAQLRVLLRAMESRLAALEETFEAAPQASAADGFSAASPEEKREEKRPEFDPLLHLNFDEPLHVQLDPNLDLNLGMNDIKPPQK